MTTAYTLIRDNIPDHLLPQVDRLEKELIERYGAYPIIKAKDGVYTERDAQVDSMMNQSEFFVGYYDPDNRPDWVNYAKRVNLPVFNLQNWNVYIQGLVNFLGMK